MEYAAASDCDTTIIVVTHGAVCSAFIDELVPSLGDMKHDIRYCSLSVFSTDDKDGDDKDVYVCDVLCDHSHVQV